jgi:hypothetical protein
MSNELDWAALEKAERQAKTDTIVVTDNSLTRKTRRRAETNKSQTTAEEELREAAKATKSVTIGISEIPRVQNSLEKGQTIPVNTALNRICVVLNQLKNKKK